MKTQKTIVSRIKQQPPNRKPPAVDKGRREQHRGKRENMTNLEYIIAALNDEIDDGGASYEAVVHYNINCPYTSGDRRCHCYPDDFRSGKVDTVKYKEEKPLTRELCVECKQEWLEQEVDE